MGLDGNLHHRKDLQQLTYSLAVQCELPAGTGAPRVPDPTPASQLEARDVPTSIFGSRQADTQLSAAVTSRKGDKMPEARTTRSTGSVERMFIDITDSDRDLTLTQH